MLRAASRNKSNHDDFMAIFPFLTVLVTKAASDQKENFLRNCYPKDSVIFFEGERVESTFFMFKGKVKGVHFDNDGREFVFVVYRPGEFFGDSLTLEDGKALYTTIACEPAEIWRLPQKVADQILHSPPILKYMTEILARRLRESWNNLRIFSSADAEKRLRALLGTATTIYGIRDTSGVMVPLSHRELAALAWVSRETVTRVLKKLADDGDIEGAGHGRILIKNCFFRKDQQL